MGLLMYIVFATVYILIIHLAIAIKDHFNIFLMTVFFVLGAVVGYFLHSYEVGFVGAVVLSLVFW